MESLRNRISAKLIKNNENFIRCVSKPSFISQKIFSKSLITVHQTKSVLILNKPISVEFSILELSKLLMYKFHSEYVKPNFNANLLLTDTDSLVYEECFKDQDLLDFIEYPVSSKLYDPTNKKSIW